MRVTVQARRAEALKAGFAALLERLPHGYSFEVFCSALDDWDVRAFCDGERVIGMLMQRGPELHVAVLPEVRGRWLSRRLIREVFAPILAAHGEARTAVAEDNAVGRDFVRRIRAGFANLTFDPTTALISAGGSLIGGLMQADAAESAGEQAASAANRATDTQLQMFQTQNEQQAPYRQAGYSALGTLSHGLGIPRPRVSMPVASAPVSFAPQSARPISLGDTTNSDGLGAFGELLRTRILPQLIGADEYARLTQPQRQEQQPTFGTVTYDNETGQPIDEGYFSHRFDARDLNANLAPNYEFVKEQGIGATRNMLNAAGGSLSGNTLKGITDYATNLAGNAYQQAFQNYTTNQTNIFNRLASIAGLGQTANAQGAQLAGSLAPSIASSTIGAGQARAAGTIGAANAMAGGANNALGWYQLGNLMTPTGTRFPTGGNYELSSNLGEF